MSKFNCVLRYGIRPPTQSVEELLEANPDLPDVDLSGLGISWKQTLLTTKIPHSTEVEMQCSIESFLTTVGVNFTREFRLSNKDIVDFMVEGGIAIECKTKGPALSVYRQIRRYMDYEAVNEMILFSSFHMNLPPLVNEKPTTVVKAGKAWL